MKDTHITLDNIAYLAEGSAFLGTGGGGDPWLGSILCKEAIAQYGPVPLLSHDNLSDDDQIFIAAAIGAPTVMIEKLFSLEDQDRAVRVLEKHLNREASAIISAEIGGCNSMMPVAYAAMRGLPIVDGDGMGRAFPELQMTSFNIQGVSCAPMAMADEHGNSVLFQAENGKKAEELARPVATVMGASACLSCYPMTGAQAKKAIVPHTIMAALSIGRAILESDGKHTPLERLVQALRGHEYYHHADVVFQGKISSIERETRNGWVFGQCDIEALKGSAKAQVVFQNENLSVKVDNELRAIVPDLITIVDSETAKAVPTERLSYGQRVSVIACSAPWHLTSAKALAILGPAAFGLEEDYTPFENLQKRRGADCTE